MQPEFCVCYFPKILNHKAAEKFTWLFGWLAGFWLPFQASFKLGFGV